MGKPILLAAVALATLPFGASADAVPAGQSSGPPFSAAKASPQPSRAVKLSDAELDKVTAGVTTIVFNPGRVNLFREHRRGLTCINCITP